MWQRRSLGHGAAPSRCATTNQGTAKLSNFKQSANACAILVAAEELERGGTVECTPYGDIAQSASGLVYRLTMGFMAVPLAKAGLPARRSYIALYLQGAYEKERQRKLAEDPCGKRATGMRAKGSARCDHPQRTRPPPGIERAALPPASSPGNAARGCPRARFPGAKVRS